MAVHSSPPAGLPRGVLRRVRLLHVRSRGVLRVLQPAAPMDPLHHGQHPRPDPGLAPDDAEERGHLRHVHVLPAVPVLHVGGHPRHDLHADSGRHQQRLPPRHHVRLHHQPRPGVHLHSAVLQGAKQRTGRSVVTKC